MISIKPLFKWVLILVVLYTTVTGCTISPPENEDKVLKEKIMRLVTRVESNNSSIMDTVQIKKINLKELTNYDWDSLYRFGGYASEEGISEELGFNCDICPFEVGEEESLWLFTKDQEIVSSIYFSPSFGDENIRYCDINKYFSSQDNMEFQLIYYRNVNQYMFCPYEAYKEE